MSGAVSSAVHSVGTLHLAGLCGGDARVLALGENSALDAWRQFLGPAAVFLAEPLSPAQAVDVVLDYRAVDARQKFGTFQALYHRVRDGGVYICATAGTDGAELRGLFCTLLDDLHAFHKRGKLPAAFAESAYTRSIDSVHFYRGCIALDMRSRRKPEMVYTGEAQFE